MEAGGSTVLLVENVMIVQLQVGMARHGVARGGVCLYKMQMSQLFAVHASASVS